MKITEVRAALLTKAPAFAEEYAQWVRTQFAHLADDHGPGLEGLSDLRQKQSRSDEQVFRQHIVPVCNTTRETGFPAPYTARTVYTLSPEKLAKKAKKFGEDVATQWADKIEDKLGDVTQIKIISLSLGDFSVRGKRGSQTVLIQQQRVSKVSRLGSWFNQFPARIYVDGQFTPEADYKGTEAKKPLVHGWGGYFGGKACAASHTAAHARNVRATENWAAVTCPKCLAQKPA